MMILGTSMPCSGTWRSQRGRADPPGVPPPAAQRRGAAGPPALGQRSAPRCAAQPAPAADASEAVRPRTPEFFLVQREELGVPGHTRLLASALAVFWLRGALFVASALAVFWHRRALYVTGPTSRLS